MSAYDAAFQRLWYCVLSRVAAQNMEILGFTTAKIGDAATSMTASVNAASAGIFMAHAAKRTLAGECHLQGVHDNSGVGSCA